MGAVAFDTLKYAKRLKKLSTKQVSCLRSRRMACEKRSLLAVNEYRSKLSNEEFGQDTYFVDSLRKWV